MFYITVLLPNYLGVRRMKLSVSGLAGVIVACSIFATLLLSRSSIGTISNSPSLPANAHLSPITVGLSVSGITQPRGVGSQILLTINVTSSIDLSNVVLRVDLSKVSQEWNSTGIELDNSTSSWKVNLLANTSVILNIMIDAKEVGYGRLRVEAEAPGFENWVALVGEAAPVDYLGIMVQDHGILVFEDVNGVLPPIFPTDFNFNPPITPGQLGNFTPPWPPQ